MSDISVERIIELVHQVSGLYFSDKKKEFLRRRLRERIAQSGVDGLEEYYAMLEHDGNELGELVQTLTTNKTFFMRNQAQFSALRENVLPRLISEIDREVVRSWATPVPGALPGGRNPAMRLRLWSSGCSTGEEPYSMAFTLLETLQYPRAWDVEIIATDLTRRVLETARRGVYGADSMRELPEDLRDRYMEETPDGWKVRGNVRSLVGFYESNLMDFINSPSRTMNLAGLDGDRIELPARGYFDVVFCRNVMIYFDRNGQDRLVRALYDSLRPGGVLFTGDSEPLHLFEHDFRRADDDNALYYIKPA